MLSHLVMSDILRPYGPQPTRVLYPWDSPGTNTRVGCYSLLQGIAPPDPEIEPGPPALQADYLLAEPPGKMIYSLFIITDAHHDQWLIPSLLSKYICD